MPGIAVVPVGNNNMHLLALVLLTDPAQVVW